MSSADCTIKCLFFVLVASETSVKTRYNRVSLAGEYIKMLHRSPGCNLSLHSLGKITITWARVGPLQGCTGIYFSQSGMSYPVWDIPLSPSAGPHVPRLTIVLPFAWLPPLKSPAIAESGSLGTGTKSRIPFLLTNFCSCSGSGTMPVSRRKLHKFATILEGKTKRKESRTMPGKWRKTCVHAYTNMFRN